MFKLEVKSKTSVDRKLTHSISRARGEKVARLGQSLDELCYALTIALLCTQRAHHGGKHSLHDTGEQLWAQSVSTCTSAGMAWGRTCGLRRYWGAQATDWWLGRNSKKVKKVSQVVRREVSEMQQNAKVRRIFWAEDDLNV